MDQRHRKIRRLMPVVLSVLVAGMFLGFALHSSLAFSNGDPAVDVMGQYDANNATASVDGRTTTPFFTKGALNDAPNRISFNQAAGGAIDTTNHRLFVNDISNHRVLVYNLDTNNVLADQVPDYVLGQADFNGRVVSTTQSSIVSSRGVAYDATNNRLFVADTGNNRVLVFDVTTISNGENATYVLGQTTFAGATTAVTQARLSGPQAVAYDDANNRLFVADFGNNRVMIFDVTPATIANGENASFELGQASGGTAFTSSGAATTQGRMSGPSGLAYQSASSSLFVAEFTNNRVMIFDVTTTTIANGENASFELGQASGGTQFTTATASTTQRGMSGPRGLDFDATNQRLFVSDATNNRVMIFNVATTTIASGANAVNVLGQSAFTVSTATTTQSGLSAPAGAVFDPTNSRLYVLETGNNRVMFFNVATTTIANGENASDVMGQYDADVSSSLVPIFTKGSINDTPNRTGLNLAISSAIDTTNHRFFLGDTSNNRVLVYDLDADNDLTDQVADYVLGQPNFNTVTAATTQNRMNGPRGIAHDSVNNRLFVSDTTNNRILVFDLTTIASGQSATFVLGQTLFTTATASTTQSGLNNPRTPVYDAVSSRLFVPDQNNNRVMVFDVAVGTIANGQNASYVLGQSTFITATATTTQSGMNSPRGTAYDATNKRLFVGEQTNHRVMVFNVATSTIANGQNASYVLGQPTFTVGSAATTQSGLSLPVGIAYDPSNDRLFVAETGNQRVTVFNVAPSVIANGENASNVLGQTLFTTAVTGTTQSTFFTPTIVTYDQTNNRLYVSDQSNSRTLIYNVDATAPTVSGVSPTVVTQSQITTFSAAYSDEVGVSSCTLFADGVDQGAMTITGSRSGTATKGHAFTTLAAHSIEVRCVDASGNIGTTGAVAITVSASSSGGSGGGGSTIPPQSQLPPPSAIFLSVLINDGQAVTANPNVTLRFAISLTSPNAGMVDRIAVSNDPNFTGASIEPFVSLKAWNLCLGKASCPDGSYTVYAKFYTQSGIVSEVIKDEIVLNISGIPTPAPAPIPAPIPAPTLPPLPFPPSELSLLLGLIPPTQPFLRNLGYGSMGKEVLILQKYLNQNGFPLSLTGSGAPGHETSYFGGRTFAAVKKFQTTFHKYIFVHSTVGTGYFGPLTRAFLNSLRGR